MKIKTRNALVLIVVVVGGGGGGMFGLKRDGCSGVKQNPMFICLFKHNICVTSPTNEETAGFASHPT